jgi:hypothetical protein
MSGCLTVDGVAVWYGSGGEVGGASEGVWLKSPRARKSFAGILPFEPFVEELDSEESCARENLNLTTLASLLVSTPQTKKKEERRKKQMMP